MIDMQQLAASLAGIPGHCGTPKSSQDNRPNCDCGNPGSWHGAHYETRQFMCDACWQGLEDQQHAPEFKRTIKITITAENGEVLAETYTRLPEGVEWLHVHPKPDLLGTIVDVLDIREK